MINQKQQQKIATEHFDEMANSMNTIEKEFAKSDDEFNKGLVAFHFGKVQEHYKAIAMLLEIYEKIK